ncbi:MAG: hypothetical protein K0V04_33725 [Deltaproteobacteria bacterium]|nr:hypothetical protein [Deltaproteobacteria bacterium]
MLALLGGCDAPEQTSDDEQELTLRAGDDCGTRVATALLNNGGTMELLGCDRVAVTSGVVSVTFEEQGVGAVLAGRGQSEPALIIPQLAADNKTVQLASDYAIGSCPPDVCECRAAGDLRCPPPHEAIGPQITHLVAFPTQ